MGKPYSKDPTPPPSNVPESSQRTERHPVAFGNIDISADLDEMLEADEEARARHKVTHSSTSNAKS
jgi:hypothetical protein